MNIRLSLVLGAGLLSMWARADHSNTRMTWSTKVAGLSLNLGDIHCGESAWCNTPRYLQTKIHEWQNPGETACSTAKFLLYDPVNYGPGSNIHFAAIALSIAMCTDRILYLHAPPSTTSSSRHSRGCTHASLECSFQRMTSCNLTAADIDQATILHDGTSWHTVKGSRVVRVHGEINKGRQENEPPCHFCRTWHETPLLKHIPLMLRSYMLATETPLMSQLVRYVLRPLPHFDKEVRDFLAKQSWTDIPRPFASMHVRYGDKYKEAPRVPLSVYMNILNLKAPLVKDVFLFTETPSVIEDVRAGFSNYTFHVLHYNRNLGRDAWHKSHENYVAWFANLYVSVQADVFMGSLTSNGCRLINELQRTRGDGGTEYWSVDASQYNTCN